jgi:hypothetical protein
MKPDAVTLACRIEKLLKRYEPATANRALEFVWFYRIGRLIDWTRIRIHWIGK